MEPCNEPEKVTTQINLENIHSINARFFRKKYKYTYTFSLNSITMVYLISLLPVEINDDILIILDTFDLAIVNKRFWAASKLFDIEIINRDVNMLNSPKISECDLMNIINYFSIDVKSNVFKYACKNGYDKIVRLLIADPRVDPAANNNEAIRWLLQLESLM